MHLASRCSYTTSQRQRLGYTFNRRPVDLENQRGFAERKNIYIFASVENQIPVVLLYSNSTDFIAKRRISLEGDKEYCLYINYQHDALIIIYSKNTILLYMFRASSSHLQEDIVVYMYHMVPSLSIRVPGGLSKRS